MRYYLFCTLFLLHISIGFSQNSTNKVYTLKKDKAINVKSFNQIIPDFPKNITWISMEIILNIGGKHGTKYFKGTNLDGINLAFLSQAKVNSFIFLSMKCKVTSGEILYRKYRIKVVE